MGSRLLAARRRLPKRFRTGALRLLGRRPIERERVIVLRLPLRPSGPAAAPPTLTIRTPERTYVSRLLETGGLAGYEPDTLACFLGAIEERGDRPVFDVGANIGVFSWLAAALTRATVVAFEPTPDLAAQMRSICRVNALDVTVEEVALGAAPGRAELHLSDMTDSSNSLRAGFRPSHRSVSVPVETMDAYAARTGTSPAVIKVDTESTEPDVLRGAAGLLASEHPWIICEVLAGRTETDLMSILAPLGYSLYLIDGPGPLQARPVIEGDSSYVHMNWLFTPSPPPASFWERSAAWRAAIAAIPAAD